MLFKTLMACGLAALTGAAALSETGQERRRERPEQERPARLETPASGLPLATLHVDGRERSFLIARPAGEPPRAGYPVIIGLHGGGPGDSESAAQVQSFHTMDLGEPALVGYPNGIDAQWNDGRGVTFGRGGDLSADDIGFLSALIDHLVSREGADASRIYLTGASNGAMMTHRAGCELAAKLAAIAPVIGMMPEPIAAGCAPGAPLPVLMIVGEADPWMPYEGGTVAPFGRASGEVISAQQTIALWAEANRCAPEPAVEHDRPRAGRDGTRVRRESYSRCAAATHLLVVEGGGHGWPGSERAGRRAARILGPTSNQIDASTEIWNFFREQRR